MLRPIQNSLPTSSKRVSRQHCVCIDTVLCLTDFDKRPARINAAICAEVETTMKEDLPPCSEWTEVAINSKLADIVAKVSGRAFVGEELCQDPEYLDCAKNYTLLLFGAVFQIKPIRPWLRPFLVPRLPAIQQLRDMEKRAARHLEPIVRERMEAEKNDPNWQKPDDMMQWLINHGAEQPGGLSVEYLAEKQLGLIFAAIHTTTGSATNIIYALAATPEYHDPLREEIANAMSENDGKITTRAMQQMVKLDSYMKEVFRLYPNNIGTHIREYNMISHNLTIPASILRTSGSQRHQPLKRPIHPPRCGALSPRRRHLRRLGSLSQQLYFRRLPALQAAPGRHTERSRAQPIRHDQRVEPWMGIREPRLPRALLCGQRNQNDGCETAA
jgi:hypothetical protein